MNECFSVHKPHFPIKTLSKSQEAAIESQMSRRQRDLCDHLEQWVRTTPDLLGQKLQGGGPAVHVFQQEIFRHNEV